MLLLAALVYAHLDIDGLRLLPVIVESHGAVVIVSGNLGGLAHGIALGRELVDVELALEALVEPHRTTGVDVDGAGRAALGEKQRNLVGAEGGAYVAEVGRPQLSAEDIIYECQSVVFRTRLNAKVARWAASGPVQDDGLGRNDPDARGLPLRYHGSCGPHGKARGEDIPELHDFIELWEVSYIPLHQIDV